MSSSLLPSYPAGADHPALRGALSSAPTELMESEARFRATFENAAVGIAHVAPDGLWLLVNKRLREITGYPGDELLSKTFQDITHPADLAASLAYLRLMLEGNIDNFSMEKRYLRKDGSVIWARLTVGCVRNADRTLEYFVSVVEDISEQKNAELALRESEERLRLALDAAELGAWQWEAANGSGAAEWDARSKALFGLPPDATVSDETWVSAIPSEDRGEVEADVARALDPANPSDDFIREHRVKHPDGRVLWLCARGRAYFEPDPASPSGRRVVSMAGTVRDVTQAHLAEAGRRDRERRHRYLLGLEKRLQSAKSADEALGLACENLGLELGATFAGIGELEPGGEYIVIENAWTVSSDPAAFLGRHRLPDLCGERAGRLLAGLTVAAAYSEDRRVREGGEKPVSTFFDGRSSIGVPVMRDSRPCAFLFVIDNAPRLWTGAEAGLAKETLERAWQSVEKAKADALRESEERLRHLGDSLPDSAVFRYSHDSEGRPRFLYISAGVEQLNGVRAEDVMRDAGCSSNRYPRNICGRLPMPNSVAPGTFQTSRWKFPCNALTASCAGCECEHARNCKTAA